MIRHYANVASNFPNEASQDFGAPLLATADNQPTAKDNFSNTLSQEEASEVRCIFFITVRSREIWSGPPAILMKFE